MSLEKYYGFMANADMFVAGEQWSAWKTIIFSVLMVVVVISSIIAHVDIKERKNYDCLKAKHKWKGRGAFGCHCLNCHITLKEFVEKGGKV